MKCIVLVINIKNCFWLEIDETGATIDILDYETPEAPDIPLQSITGLQHSRTMQGITKIQDCPMKVFVEIISIY